MLGFNVEIFLNVSFKDKEKAKFMGCWWSGKRWFKKYNCGYESLLKEISDDIKLYIKFDIIDIKGLSLDDELKEGIKEHVRKIREQYYKKVEDEFKKIISKEDIEENPELLNETFDEEWDEYIKEVNNII